MRQEETKTEHLSRIKLQKERQKQLRATQLPQEIKERRLTESLSKIVKRSAKADAFENSLNPNEKWNKKLDQDMIRQQISRSLETEDKKQKRKKRDAEYHKLIRSGETSEEKTIRKQKDIHYHHRTRIHDEEKKSEERLEKYKEKNIKPLHLHGSYFRFLSFGKARTSYSSLY